MCSSSYVMGNKEEYLAPVVKLTLQIRPELFEDIGRHIDSDLHAELVGGIARGAIVHIVSSGNGDRRGVPCDLRVVKLGAAGIGMIPEDLAGGVSQPGPSTPLAFTEVARVLVKQDGKYAFGHVVADDQVAISRAEISAESGGALAERAVRIRRLGFCSEDTRENDRPAVEGIFGSHFKFLARRERLVVLEARRASVIRDNAQQALALCWGRAIRRRRVRR